MRTELLELSCPLSPAAKNYLKKFVQTFLELDFTEGFQTLHGTAAAAYI